MKSWTAPSGALRCCAAALLFATAASHASAQAGGCPSTGSCFAAHAGGGCEIAACCSAVCAVDPFCCSVQWDSICANEAVSLCNGCGSPGSGSCFAAHPTLGCDIGSCCTTVCNADSFCCQTEWDSICVDEAIELCPAACGNPNAGSCFSQHGPGCSDASCCESVCAFDSFCCATQWDSICVEEAYATCTACGEESSGSCYSAHGNPTCNDDACCANVCVADPFCCATQWDSICADEAIEMCPGCGNPNAGDCFAEHGPFCADEACCETVCADDGFCCENEWDSICVDEAFNLCGGCGNPASGSCYTSHPNTGCELFDCCVTVCIDDGFCCDVEWDGICADEAIDLCPGCGNPAAGDCGSSHSTPFCSDADCCQTVCATDPFCCDVSWDSICASESSTLCNSCGVCDGDLDGNGVVAAPDLATILGAWGSTNACADIDNNGIVGASDIAILLGAWGPCN